jgi:hypothetical protein
MKVKRIFLKDGNKLEYIDEVSQKSPTEICKIAVYKGDPYEFVMFNEPDDKSVDWELFYSFISDPNAVSYGLLDVDVISMEEEAKCDCGAAKFGFAGHAYWCSTQPKRK